MIANYQPKSQIRMKKLVFFAIAGVLMYGCSNSKPKTETAAAPAPQNLIEITNDMENALAVIPSWSNEKTVIAMKEPAAHSGEYACALNDSTEYSYAFNELAKNINTGVPKTILVNGWVYTTTANPDFSIVLNVSENQKAVDWKVFPLKDELKETGKWVEFTATFYPEKTMNPEQNINLYAWNPSKQKLFIDDLKISFIY
jgi:hypothetical protein